MAKQFIISIGREYGSGGRVIAEHLAKTLNVTSGELLRPSTDLESQILRAFSSYFLSWSRLSFFSWAICSIIFLS